MKKIIIPLFLVLFIAVAVFAFLNYPKEEYIIDDFDRTGLVVLTPMPNEVISSPLKIEGFVNGEGWIGFEGEVGIVRLFDNSGNEMALGILTAIGEWMQVKINFETELNFLIPEDQAGYLVFYNSNPSGEPERDKTFIIPIRFR